MSKQNINLIYMEALLMQKNKFDSRIANHDS